MERIALKWLMVVLVVLLPGWGGGAVAQIPVIGIIGEAAKKIVVALDIHVQKLQTETIGLQIAAKEVENAMALSKLTEITSWVQQQKDQYAKFYSELWQIKNAIGAYQRIKDMIGKQAQIVGQYKQISSVIRADGHFTPNEVAAISGVLTGILQESIANIGQLSLVIKAFIIQMGDGDRLRIIDETGSRIDKNYTDMQVFYQQSLLLSLERAKDVNDMAVTKKLYGIE